MFSALGLGVYRYRRREFGSSAIKSGGSWTQHALARVELLKD